MIACRHSCFHSIVWFVVIVLMSIPYCWACAPIINDGDMAVNVPTINTIDKNIALILFVDTILFNIKYIILNYI